MDLDRKVKQSGPNQNDFCNDLDLTYKGFYQLGDGTAPNYYHGRYFAFRPLDG